jgi:hypothetical protein
MKKLKEYVEVETATLALIKESLAPYSFSRYCEAEEDSCVKMSYPEGRVNKTREGEIITIEIKIRKRANREREREREEQFRGNIIESV